jgi:hypothetical protein
VKWKTTYCNLIIGILLWPGTLFAQYKINVDGYSDFSRRLDAFQWNLGTDIGLKSDLTNVQFRNSFTSRLYLIRGTAQNIQDEYRSSLDVNHLLKQGIGIGLRSDVFGYTASKVRQERILAGPSLYGSNKRFEIRPMIGLMSDTRNNTTDTGPSFGLTGSWPNLVLGDFRFNPDLIIDYASIQPRSFGSFKLGSDTRYSDEFVQLNGNFQIGRSIRESYQASNFLNRDISDLIESIRSDTARIQAGLEFPIGNGSTGRIDVYTMSNNREFTNRILKDTLRNDIVDTRFIRQDYDLAFQAFIPKGNIRFNPGLRFLGTSTNSDLINAKNIPDDQFRRRSEILERSNFKQNAIEVFANSTYTPMFGSELGIRVIVGILRYNTPEINVDDRDEQTIALRLIAKHKVSQWLDVGLTMAGEAYHNVYLFSARSAENNWRRSLRILPEITWQPSSTLIVRNAMFIRANYTVYDFQVPGRLNADQAAREYGYRSRVEYEFMPNWFVEIEGARSELRIGRLQWNTFTETPIDTLISYESEITLSKKVGQLKLSTGIRSFRKIDFLPQATTSIIVTDPSTGEKTFTRLAPGVLMTQQLGPLVQVMLPLSAKNELFIDGWFQQQKARSKLYTEYPEEFRDEFLARERRFARIQYPNLSMRARFRF